MELTLSPNDEGELSYRTVMLETTFNDSIISEDYIYDRDVVVERTCIGSTTCVTMEVEVDYGRP